MNIISTSEFQHKGDESGALHKQIAAIGIRCDAELRKWLRIGDSCGEKVMKIVTEQNVASKELVIASVKEIL